MTGQILADVVHRKSATAGSLDGWEWRELKVSPVSWYDELARILSKVERGSVEAWCTTALGIEEVLSGAVDSHVHLLVADVINSFDTVDRGILDSVLSSLGLPTWFRHAYFEYHAHVRLRFELAAGLGEPWTRDGGIHQGCPLSMMFIVALYLPWCRYLSVEP